MTLESKIVPLMFLGSMVLIWWFFYFQIINSPLCEIKPCNNIFSLWILGILAPILYFTIKRGFKP